MAAVANVVRSHEAINAARVNAATDWLPRTRESDFVLGAIAAYDWLLGLRDLAPVSGVHQSPTAEAILHEERVADDATYRRARAPILAPRYAVGVATALAWARGVAEDAPGTL